MDGLVIDHQRSGERVPFNNNVRFSIDQFNWHSGMADNISKGGIFLITDKMVEVGSKIYLTFNLPSTFQSITARGKIVRVVNTRGGNMGEEDFGMGIQFFLRPGEKLIIRSFIRGILSNPAPIHSSNLQDTAPYIIKGGTKTPFFAMLTWWVKEEITKLVKVNYLVAELIIFLFVAVVIRLFFVQ